VEEKPELFFQPPDCIDDRVGWQNAVHVERDLQSKVAEACEFFQKVARSGRKVILAKQLPATFGGVTAMVMSVASPFFVGSVSGPAAGRKSLF
jgi:hypothetical protein